MLPWYIVFSDTVAVRSHTVDGRHSDYYIMTSCMTLRLYVISTWTHQSNDRKHNQIVSSIPNVICLNSLVNFNITNRITLKVG